LSLTGHLEDAAVAGGSAVVAWTSGGAVAVGYRQPDGQWDTAVLGSGSRPRVAVNADGLGVVVWQSSDADSAVEAAVRPPAGTWAAPMTVSTSGRSPTPAVTADGTVRVLALRWGTPAPTRTDVQLFSSSGSGWSSAQVLNGRRLENN